MEESEFIFREVEVRSLFVAVVAALALAGVHAAEQVAESMPVPEVVAPVMVYDLAPVTPAGGIRKNDERRVVAEIRSVDKPKLAKKLVPSKSMLSRTARSQMALLASKPQQETAISLNLFDSQDDDTGADDLDLHRSFSRPRLAQSNDQDDGNDAGVSDYVKLRLFMARMKAIEVHKMAEVAAQHDDGADALSDSVKIRLAMARMKAIQAHEKKFS